MVSQKGPGTSDALDGFPLRIAIIHSRWNPSLIQPLITGVRTALLAHSVHPTNISTISVPGAYELPLTCLQTIRAGETQAQASAAAAQKAAGSGQKIRNLGDPGEAGAVVVEEEDTEAGGKGAQRGFDAVVAVGVLIKGETMHFEYISEAVSQGLMRVQLDTGVPVVFGLLTLLSVGQGEARAGLVQGEKNVGEEWGKVAVEVGGLKRAMAEGKGL